MKRDCQKFMEWGNGNPEKYAEWNEKNPSRCTRITDIREIASKLEITTGEMIIFPVIIAGNQDMWQESAEN